jgi:soluble lytic murein transglycosylase-like protein
LAVAPVRRPARCASGDTNDTPMLRIAGPLLGFALAAANTSANAQAGAAPATPQPSTASELREPSAQSPTVDDICRALEQSAAENALPVEFFARVIWQESRFDARAVSPKGAAGIAQFMPATDSRNGLADPFGRTLAAAPTRRAFEQFRTSREVSE